VMLATVSRLTGHMTHTLQLRMILFTILLLTTGSSMLTWHFMFSQIDFATKTLLMSGEELAVQLAGTTQHSVVVKDSRRIQELIRSTVALENVDYVFIAARDNTLLGAMGSQEFKRLAGDTLASDWLPLLTSRRAQAIAAQTHLPPVSFHIIERRLVTEASFTLKAGQWIALLLGSERPHFFDLVVPVRQAQPAESDPALGLAFEEMGPGVESAQDRSESLYGVVQIGVTDRHLQHTLRSLVGQAIFITLAILAAGIAIAVYFTRRMTQPLSELTAVARQVGAGNLTAVATLQSSGEIGELAQVFNQMTAALRSRQQELLDLNRNLEARVDSRTNDLKKANGRLQELDRVKTNLVSTASHELRTPLTAIMVHVRNLVDGVRGNLTSHQRESLELVQGNIERLRTLIDNLLDLSILHAGGSKMRHDAVALSPLIHEVVDSLRCYWDLKRIFITNALSGTFPDIPGDREKLRRIFTNVLHNAIKFTPEGGRIHIEGRQTDDAVTVSVQDSGQGIPQEEQEKVFLPFFRCSENITQNRGSGLGLSITKELVQLHQGTIWVESTVGHGSCFFVRFPTAPADTTASAPATQRFHL
jgi:signal transduction histidine kinase